MANKITDYLSQYVEITEELETVINESSFIKDFKKGTILLKEGDLSTECYFILKGCIRCYYQKDGEEKTTEFYTEGQALTPSCYGKEEKSNFFLECIEDTIAGIGTPDSESEMYQKYPQLESLSRLVGEELFIQYQDTLADFKMSSPEERYLSLLKNRPDLIERVPQHQIASYLGIKPESLSRIRKRIVKK